jgi:hypothetical protein
MTVFDLVFLALFFVGAGALVTAAIVALRGRRTAARAILRRLALSAVVYLGVVALVSLVSPRRFVNIGDEQCSDDWCIAVTGVQRRPGSGSVSYELTFRLSSRARRVGQRELGVVVYLRDARGHRHDPDPQVVGVPFDIRLEPLQQVTTARVFTVPPDTPAVGLVISREGNGLDPGCCIIGDEGSLLHKATVVRLE